VEYLVWFGGDGMELLDSGGAGDTIGK